MKTISALIIFCFLVTACSSSYVVNSTSPAYDSSIQEFNELAEVEEAEIILADSTVINATDVYLSADSLHWFNPETELKTGVVKSEVRKITFTDDLRGGLEGAGLGFLSGAVVGVLTFFTIAMILDGEPAKGEYAGSYYAVFAVSGAGLGLLTGFTVGMLNGHTYEYEFQNAEQRENIDK
jgi:hypothetical protein